MVCRRSAWAVAVLVLACAANAQRDFSCLRRNEGLECVRCVHNITVDPVSGEDCGARGTSLAGVVCSRLADALESIAAGHTTHPPSLSSVPEEPCIAVYVYTSAAPHIIASSDLRSRTVTATNVVLQGVGGRDPSPSNSTTGPAQQPQVRFEPIRGALLDTPSYVFRSNRSLLLGLRNIDFVGSLGGIGTDNVATVIIEECRFSNFIQGAVDVYNSLSVRVTGSLFAGNGFIPVSKPEQYRGHAGGLAIGYNSRSSLRVTISNCTFYNNSAELSSDDIIFPSQENTTESARPPPPSLSGGPPSRDTSSTVPADEAQQVRGGAIADRSFPGRGGGVALIVNSVGSATLLVEDCFFVDNAALESGGGLYILLDGLSSHTVTVSRTLFTGNLSPSTAGGIQITFLQEGARGRTHSVSVLDSNFTSNQAVYGGAVFFLPLSVNVLTLDDGQLGIFTKFENCLFTDNSAVEVGGALGAAFYILSRGAQSINPLEIVDCTFTRNSVIGGGVVSTAYFPLSFYGSNKFELNNGPSLAIVGSRVRVHGSLLFSNNSNTGSLDGGAVYITSLGQMELTHGASITFFNNSGTLGASLVVQNPPLSAPYSRLLYNPLCSLIHSDSRSPPDQWNASLTFSSNEAIVASAVFMNNLDFCSWTQLSEPYFDPSRVFRWDFVDYSMNINRGHGNQTDQRFSVQTPAVRLRTLQKQISAFPGENIGLRVVALDELGVATSALFTLSDRSMDGSSDETREIYRFTPSSLNLVKVGSNESLDVRMKVLRDTPPNRAERIHAMMISDNQKFVNVRDSFSISSRPCPPGQRLTSGGGDFSECECDTGDVDIINCDRREVHINDHLWGTFVPAMMGSNQLENSLVTMTCPSQYCLCTALNTSGILKCTNIFNELDPYAQCSCNRTGVLCGDCTDGLGFSALLDSCVSCSNAYSMLVVVLAIVDLGIIIVILAVSTPPPLWLYPVLFHLQLLPHYTTHFPATFEEVRPYLLYVASALGLYFPYDFCLYEEASPLATYVFRYIPFLLAVVAVPVAMAVRRRFPAWNPWHGVSWLLLLLYTPTVHTSMTILNCPSFLAQNFNSSEVSSERRWFVNGNISCFTGGHIPLGLLALVILLLSASVMFLPLAAMIAKKIDLEWCSKLCDLAISAFSNSFKYEWWFVLELFRRFFLLAMAVWYPGNNYPVIFTLFVFTAVTGFVKPYGKRERQDDETSSGEKKKDYAWTVNILETFLAINVLTLLLLRNTESVEEDYEELPGVSLGKGYDRCNPVRGMTKFAIFLTPLYYLPLLVSTALLGMWLIKITVSAVKTHSAQPKKKKDTHEVDEAGGVGNGGRPHSHSVVDFRTYTPDDIDDSSEHKAQPDSLPLPDEHKGFFRTLSNRWKRGSSRKKKKKEEIELKEKKSEPGGVAVGGGSVNGQSKAMKQQTSSSSVIITVTEEDISYTEI